MCLRIVVAVAGKRHGLINSDDIHDILVVCFLLLGLILSNSRVVKPDSSPCQLIVIIAGMIETAVEAEHQRARGLARVPRFLMRCNGKLIKCLCVLQSLCSVFRCCILEIQIVNCKRSGCTRSLIRRRHFGRSEICGALNRTGRCRNNCAVNLKLGCTPVVMVILTFADLIAVSDNIAVIIEVGSLHKVVIDPAKCILNMFLKADFDIILTEFIVAPADCRSGKAARKSELHMVTGIMPAAGQIERSVSVRIEILFVCVNEFLRHIDAFEKSRSSTGTAVTAALAHRGFVLLVFVIGILLTFSVI